MTDVSAVAFRVLGPRTNLTGANDSLDLIGVDVLPDGALCWVTAVSASYRYYLYRTDPPNGITIIQPSVGVGRWIREDTGGGSDSGMLPPVNTITEGAIGSGRLVDIDTSAVADGTTIWVNSVESFFSFDATSVLAADAITVADPLLGPGRWLRIIEPSIRWERQTAWFMDATTGDDEFDGTAAAPVVGTLVGPIRTQNELKRRINMGSVSSDTLLTYGSGSYGDLSLDLNLSAQFTLQGNLSVSATGTLSAVTATNPATSTRGLVANTGGDPAFVDKTRLRLTSGAFTGAITRVTRVPAANQANDSGWGTTDLTIATPVATVITPVAGNTYAVDAFNTTLGKMDLRARGAGRFVVRECNIAASGGASNRTKADLGNDTGIVFYSCDFITTTTRFREGSAAFYFCSFQQTTTIVEGIYRFVLSVICDLMGTNVAAVLQFLQSNTFDGGELLVQSNATFQNLGNTQFVDQTSTSVTVQAPGTITSDTHPLWGANNGMAAAFQMRDGGTLYYTNGVAPTIPGGVVDCIIGGDNKAYADLPFPNPDNFSGIVERS